jgi:hypothetical protein
MPSIVDAAGNGRTTAQTPSVGGLYYVRFVDSCDHGIRLIIQPPTAARVVKVATAADGAIVAAVVQPLTGRQFTVETAGASMETIVLN